MAICSFSVSQRSQLKFDMMSQNWMLIFILNLKPWMGGHMRPSKSAGRLGVGLGIA